MKIPMLGESKRMWLIGGAVVAALIALAGWFMVINPELSAASADRDQTASANLQNQALAQRNDKLKEKNGDKGALQAGLSAALEQLPSDGGLSTFTRQLSAQAKAATVDLTSVIVGAATPLGGANPQGATTATAQSPPTAGTTTAAPSSSSSSGVVQMTITVTATGLGRSELAFLRAIQWSGPRRALVTAVQLSPASGSGAAGIDGKCNLTMSLTIFSAPLSPSAQAALEKLLSEK